MEKPVKEIRENYSKYEELVKETKSTSISPILLDEIKDNHKNTRIKKVEIQHNTLSERLELSIESKIKNKKDFKFKLRAPNYIGTPFFRFDSDGLAHYNRTPDEELPKQKIDTPHFHKFDSNGRNIAYQTDSLKKENERKALLNDINLCLAHYCDESKTYFNKKHYIEVIQTPQNELDFDNEYDNPLEGVNYE